MRGTPGRGKKRKGGGLHQRRARVDEDAADAPSALHVLLMTWLAQGMNHEWCAGSQDRAGSKARH